MRWGGVEGWGSRGGKGLQWKEGVVDFLGYTEEDLFHVITTEGFCIVFYETIDAWDRDR